jgi:hypothetical protein
MGLFDTVKCDYPLPDPAHQELEVQTKDLDRGLEQYAITRDGRLLRHPRGCLFPAGRGRAVEWPIHGDLRIYESVERQGGGGWVEYVLRFREGQAQSVKRLEPRQDDSEEPDVEVGKPAAPEPAGEGPVGSSVEGRQLTADAFIEHAHFGLREVASRVGREVWEAAIER